MKVYINRKPISGPWGGGNKTVTRLAERLQEQNIEVVHSLQPNIEIIFCFDPRPNESGEWYKDFLNYKLAHGTKIIQRVGDLGTHSKPHLTELVKQSVTKSDFVIFPSDWAKRWLGFKNENSKIINNRPLSLFHENKKHTLISDKIKIITHHWSTNEKKGFQMYKQLDDYLKENQRYEFTYVGRLPNDFVLNNSNYVEPTDAAAVSKILPQHHLYLTASVEEAGANHVLEALAAGLPIIYDRAGGSIVDYCKKFGEGYDSFEEMIKKINKVLDKYELYKNKVMGYNDTIDDAIDQYIEIILSAAERKDNA